MNEKDNGIWKRNNEEQDMPIQNRLHVKFYKEMVFEAMDDIVIKEEFLGLIWLWHVVSWCTMS